jgi:hypothetical protein
VVIDPRRLQALGIPLAKIREARTLIEESAIVALAIRPEAGGGD